MAESIASPLAAAPAPAGKRNAGPLSWRLYRHTVGGTWKAFGPGWELYQFGVQRPIVTTMSHVFLGLDHLFFPGFRKTPVDRPVFLIGHPRSGTTFVHRLLTQTREFTVFEFWETMTPSLCARKLTRPIVEWLNRTGRGVLFPKETGHLNALKEVEEEELLFFHTGNTQFTSCLSPLAFSDWDFTELVMADEQPPAIRRSAMKFLRGCLQRQIYLTGKPRAVTKMNYSAMRTRSLLEEFPDARFVYIVRSPLETIPSHLTLHRNMFEHMWKLRRIPPNLLQRYYERRYRHNLEFYRYMETLIESRAVPQNQLLVVPYNEFKTNLAAQMDQIIDFTELECSPELRKLINEQAAAQSGYERPHRNQSLEEFGLTTERLLSDFDFVFQKYGFPRE